MEAEAEKRKAPGGGLGLIWSLAAVSLLPHFLTNSRYGYFRDELYYIICGRHLAFGYVDQPPFSLLLVRLSSLLFGDSLFALRLFPALASALTIALTGLIARELGGRRGAVALSCTGALCATVYLVSGNLFSMNAFEPPIWMGCVYLLLRLQNEGSPRLWLWFGLLAGIGLENKHSMVFFGLALIAGVLGSPLRRHFAQKWIWLGGLIAFLLALPNVLWEFQHHWATWELLRNVARSHKNVLLTPPQFVAQQVLIMNPATLPLWLGGLVWLGVSNRGRRYRALAIIYLVILGELLALHGKVYYLAPAYPMLLAAGGVAWESWCREHTRWAKPILLGAMIVTGAMLAPVALAILPPAQLVAYLKAIHLQPPQTETSHTAALPQHLSDQFGWRELTASVARAYHALPPNEQRTTAILAQNYGEAAAIDFFGPALGLPKAISGHQNYYLWGPRDYTGATMLILDQDDEYERKSFQSVIDLGPVETSPWAQPYEQRVRLYLCRGPARSLPELWPRLKHWL